MERSLIALIGTVVMGATAFSSIANAGFKVRLGFGGPLPAFTAHGHGGHGHRHYERKRYIVRPVARSQERVAKKATPATHKIAKAEKAVSKPKAVDRLIAKEAQPTKTAEIENSSITTALADPTETAVIQEPEASSGALQPAAAGAAPKAELTASKVDCRKFFPSVGMTLSVPCE